MGVVLVRNYCLGLRKRNNPWSHRLWEIGNSFTLSWTLLSKSVLLNLWCWIIVETKRSFLTVSLNSSQCFSSTVYSGGTCYWEYKHCGDNTSGCFFLPALQRLLSAPCPALESAPQHPASQSAHPIQGVRARPHPGHRYRTNSSSFSSDFQKELERFAVIGLSRFEHRCVRRSWILIRAFYSTRDSIWIALTTHWWFIPGTVTPYNSVTGAVQVLLVLQYIFIFKCDRPVIY